MKSGNGIEDGGNDKEATAKPPIPEFGEHVSSFEVVKRYLCSYNIDDIRLSRLELLERELFFIHHISPIKQKLHSRYTCMKLILNLHSTQ